jgi:hypothetical protein
MPAAAPIVVTYKSAAEKIRVFSGEAQGILQDWALKPIYCSSRLDCIKQGPRAGGELLGQAPSDSNVEAP